MLNNFGLLDPLLCGIVMVQSSVCTERLLGQVTAAVRAKHSTRNQHLSIPTLAFLSHIDIIFRLVLSRKFVNKNWISGWARDYKWR